MSSRFRRDFKLTIGIGSNKVVITPPFNIGFSGVENVLNRSLNKLNVTIPGLGESKRQQLIKYELDKSKYLPIELLIGHEGKLYRAFKGSVRTGELSREGATFVNTLECYDGWPDFNESYTSRVVEGRELAVDAILNDMPNTQKGSVTGLAETLRPKVLVGSSSELLAKIAQGKEFYIKDEKIFILNDDEVVSAVIPEVSARTGLKNTPQKDHIETTFVTVMNPTLAIGKLCNLQSITDPSVNGVYKIIQISPNGKYKDGPWEQVVTCRRANGYKVVR